MPRPSLLFRTLVRLYPRAYRARYGTEMEAFHLQELAAGAGGWAYATGLVVDHLKAATGVWWRGGVGTMNRTFEDLAAGLRALSRARAFTTFAVLTLALGIGATTAVFTVLDRVVLRPLPYPGSERLVRVGIDARHNPGEPGPLSGPLLQAFQDATGPAEAFLTPRRRDGCSRTAVSPSVCR